jgi:hypothetical protein
MVEQFKKLSESEFQNLLDAPALITLLIAGADGNFEKEELEWSKKIAHIRSYKMKGGLKTYYQHVDENIEAKLEFYINTLPASVGERTKIISDKLQELNVSLAKLDSGTGSKLYKSFTSLADHVAKASGGVMGFFAINKNEAKLIHLPMIVPIVHKSDEEE